ncbi:hypothetical protein [Helicobacter sp. L8]|uniref:putative barnase/colicin E5 family endoribonuclease n=1 Tax=Helicobacter sp. L8 TaxID=2316078 RepID=UPI0013CDE271|nr:hypothetical protein [Helicobacter sp. L8]
MKAIAQESDLDISLLTSFKLTSPQASSTRSVLAKKSGTDLKEVQEPLEKSNSNPGTSASGNAYNRLDSKLNQKSTSLSGGKGIDESIDKPLDSVVKDSTTPLKIEANPAFGENFAEFEGKGAEAVKKLLKEKRGQVAGAFYKEGLGYITLPWGEVGSGKSDGWGLSKIAKYHPEVLDKLEELVQTLPIVKETPNRYQLEDSTYKASIRKDFEGKAENWVLTAFEKKESIAKRSTDLPSTQEGAKKTPLADAKTQDSTTPLKDKEQEPKIRTYQDQQEELKKLFSIENPQEPFKPPMDKQALEAIESTQERPFSMKSADFGFGIPYGLEAQLKSTLEHPDALFQDEFCLYLVKRIEDKIYCFRVENSLSSKYFEVLTPLQLETIETKATKLGNGIKAKSRRQINREQMDIYEARDQVRQQEQEASKPPIKKAKPKDYKQPQSLEGLEELPRVDTKLPINKSFGQNHNGLRGKGKDALLGLMYERTQRNGQVAPAYYHKELGSIDIYTQHGGEVYKDVGRIATQAKGLETFKNQPEAFLTPVGRLAGEQAKRDFKKWRNNHIATYLDKVIKEGDITKGKDGITLSLRDTYNNKTWDFNARIEWSNNNDPSQPRRWILEEFKVVEDSTHSPISNI